MKKLIMYISLLAFIALNSCGSGETVVPNKNPNNVETEATTQDAAQTSPRNIQP